MPGPFVATTFWQHGLNGWTEVYPMLSASYIDCQTSLAQILNRRIDMVTAEIRNVSNRISDITVRGDSKLVAGLETGTYVPGAGDTSPDPVVVKVRLEAGTAVRSTRYLHAIPEEVIEDGIYNPPAGWITAMSAYLTAIKDHSGILIKDAGPPVTYSIGEISDTIISGVWTRKVGRPFGLHRGRRQTVAVP